MILQVLMWHKGYSYFSQHQMAVATVDTTHLHFNMGSEQFQALLTAQAEGHKM